MFENLLNHHWLVATSLFFLMAVAGELGYRIGIKSHIEDDQNRKEQINAKGSDLFVLLSLLLSFALTMAVSRYDQRRELVVREADAIGTCYSAPQSWGDLTSKISSNHCAATSMRKWTSLRWGLILPNSNKL